MKVAEILAQWTDEAIRSAHSRNLIAVLTPMSINELLETHTAHDPLQGHEKFLAEQQDVLARILSFECSHLGGTIRAEHGLDVLTMDMEI